MDALVVAAKEARRVLQAAPTVQKNKALKAMAKALRAHRADLLAVNAKDVADAKAAGKDAAFVDRLMLDAKRVEAMAKAVEQIAEAGGHDGSPKKFRYSSTIWTASLHLWISKSKVWAGGR